ncbi:hypothetical protein [Tepidibacter sp. Z1-5]|uniref:hypothetical protein n=1 Tax=Tepidibacter sp. Z1-5 TaxID=3134138 RepID=UPI0030C235B9
MSKNSTIHSNKHLLSTLLYCENSLKRRKRKAYVRKDGTSNQLGYEWACAINDMYGVNRCEHRNMVIKDNMIDKIKEMILKLKNTDMKCLLEIYLSIYHSYDISEERVNTIKKQELELDDTVDKCFSIYIEGKMHEEQYHRLNEKHKEQLDDIRNELDKIIHYEKKVEEIKQKYKQWICYINEINLDGLTNSKLKKIFSRITIKTCKTKNLKSNNYMKTIFIDYNFIDVSIEKMIKDLDNHDINDKQDIRRLIAKYDNLFALIEL